MDTQQEYLSSATNLYCYRLYGRNISTNVPLMAPEAPGQIQEVDLELCAVQTDALLQAARRKKLEPIHVPEVGQLLRLSNQQIWFAAAGNLPDWGIGNLIEKFTLQFALMNSVGFLHASAVSIKGVGIGLAGISGAGKSTLAHYLADQGGDFYADDVLGYEFVGGYPVLLPGNTKVKLRQKSVDYFCSNSSSCAPIHFERFSKVDDRYTCYDTSPGKLSPIPLRYLIVMDSGQCWDLEELSFDDAYKRLLPLSGITALRMYPRLALEWLKGLVSTTRVLKLTRSQQLEDLEDIAARIAGLLV